MAANIPPPAVMKLSGDWSTNWDTFRGEWEDYALATGLLEKDDEVVAATLRTIMGTECRHVYKHNLNLTAAQQGNATAILDALEHYFKPAKNVIYERYVFGCCKQEDGESIDSFVTRLREKAATCDYGALRDELIRDKLVLGITDEGTRRRLLRERDLTLVLAVETCRAAELTDIRVRSMELERQHMDNVNATFRQPVRKFPFATANTTANSAADNPNTCRYCGISHGRGKEYCPAYGKICKSCGTANHFARVCMKSKRKEGKVHSIETNTDEGNNSTEDVYASECIGAVRAKGQKWFVTLLLNNKPQQCQLDSGATCNVMSLRDKRRLAPRDKLTQSSTKLKLYSGQFMTSLGLFVTECVLRGQKHTLEFEIVEASQQPLLSGSTCERLGLINFTIPADLNIVDNVQAGPLSKETLLSKYHDVFNAPVESVPGEVHFELDAAIQPVQCAPRNVPVAMKAATKAQLDKYEADGHMISVTEPTDWISNMVIVKKPDKLRICIDPKHLNRALRRSHYIMPTLEDVLYKLPKARVFTLVDARDAFLQCKLDEPSSYMTTFWTPWGRKRWLKLPFGVSVAPEVYQRKQHELLRGLSGVEPIADDILVVGCGDSDEEAECDHDAKLLALMVRCRQVKLRLSIKKLQFKVPEVRFHGHILSSTGLKADPEKVKAVLEMPHPSDVKAVQRFVGFVTYLAKFLPRLSEVCEPLRRLMDKDTIWHWLPKHDAAVREIKQLVTQTPVLRYYDVSKPVTIQSDSSQYGLGCCLMQEGQPVAFASRALTPTEQNYAQIEKECLSIVFACQRFHHYLYGRDNITAETDHKPLIAIFSKPLLNAPKRLQSMLLALQNYNLKVVYKPGPEMYVSDTLSRATASGTHTRSMHERHAVCSLQTEQVDVEHINQADYLNVTDQRLIQIRQHTDRDEQLQALRSVILMGWPDCKEETALAVRDYWPVKEELSVQNGVIFKGQRVVIPRSLRPEMLARVHSSHIGGEACYRQARDTLYWPGMQSEIKGYVSKCTICNEYATEQQRETMMSHELPIRPWQIVSLDLFQHSGKDFLLVVDHYSDFWEIDLLPDLSAETTIKRCKAQFARYGQPDRVISDNGPQFSGVEFRKFAADWEFEHVTSSPRHPKANGKAESAVKIAKNLCKKALREGKDAWKAILQWRNTPTEGMDSSPAQRLMARRLKAALPVASTLLEPCVVTDVLVKLRHRRQVSKFIYDKSAKDLPELRVGETVRMKPLPGDRTGLWRLGSCVQKVAPRSYLVEVNGSRYRRNRVDLRIAEPAPTQNPDGQRGRMTKDRTPASHMGPEALGEEPGDHRSAAPSPINTPLRQSGDTPVREPAVLADKPPVFSRCGRLSQPPKRLNL
uniref:Gypsy retrotransposon integrase-like protein 1 n=1 Tax=Salmo trutta TaxID=8032 RepID=A0A673W9M9_SALTR